MVFIVIVAIIIYLIGISWTYQNLGFIEKPKKIATIIIGIIITYLITLITFQISKSGIEYQSVQIEKDIKNILVIIFTGLNNIIVMPQIGRILGKINEDEIKKNDVKKQLLILVVIFIICLVFESGYMKDTQKGILEMYTYRSNSWIK